MTADRNEETVRVIEGILPLVYEYRINLKGNKTKVSPKMRFVNESKLEESNVVISCSDEIDHTKIAHKQLGDLLKIVGMLETATPVKFTVNYVETKLRIDRELTESELDSILKKFNYRIINFDLSCNRTVILFEDVIANAIDEDRVELDESLTVSPNRLRVFVKRAYNNISMLPRLTLVEEDGTCTPYTHHYDKVDHIVSGYKLPHEIEASVMAAVNAERVHDDVEYFAFDYDFDTKEFIKSVTI